MRYCDSNSNPNFRPLFGGGKLENPAKPLICPTSPSEHFRNPTTPFSFGPTFSSRSFETICHVLTSSSFPSSPVPDGRLTGSLTSRVRTQKVSHHYRHLKPSRISGEVRGQQPSQVTGAALPNRISGEVVHVVLSSNQAGLPGRLHQAGFPGRSEVSSQARLLGRLGNRISGEYISRRKWFFGGDQIVCSLMW